MATTVRSVAICMARVTTSSTFAMTAPGSVRGTSVPSGWNRLRGGNGIAAPVVPPAPRITIGPDDVLNVHIVERYRMTDADTLEYEARIDDPNVYTRPWTLRTELRRVKTPGARIVEDECLEDENGVRHHISPSDPKNLLKADYSRWEKRGAK